MSATVNVDDVKVNKTLRAKLPEPTGYRLLIAIPEINEKTDGGVFMPDQLKSAEETASIIGFVLKAGPDAYKDENKFPTGAWCGEKSWVLMGRYAGNRFKVDGLEVRLINDDNIIATILDPADISYV